MKQIDLRGYPRNVQTAAKKMFGELQKMQEFAQRVYKAEEQMISAIKRCHKEGLNTEKQEAAALSLIAGELVFEAASPGYTCFRRDYLILEGENLQ